MASGIDRRCPRWRRHSMLCGCSRDTGGTRNRGPANCGCLIYGLQCLHASIRPSTRRFTRRSFFTTTCAHGCNGTKNGLGMGIAGYLPWSGRRHKSRHKLRACRFRTWCRKIEILFLSPSICYPIY
ncbi:hypothetical protein VFPFJ_04937 [Purpureocillium lilacinum]|uniref:Uncharacterized protein n=1 Tax=Purpureocillium lilacinum TaxID=33203 RepID=A0A179HM81_PURLI|nr:hypothetical protein VFPFJ_04937 [Purpureocillium lilacinum]OAQ90778.1 hypothetical protein VFPFJ_04937 [Purpureocillium lilacinum]